MQIEQTIQTVKPRFTAIFQEGLEYGATAKIIAELAEVPSSILDNMMQYLPVMQEEAEKVLLAISQATGQTYTLEMLDIPLIQLDISVHLTVLQGIQDYEQPPI